VVLDRISVIQGRLHSRVAANRVREIWTDTIPFIDSRTRILDWTGAYAMTASE